MDNTRYLSGAPAQRPTSGAQQQVRQGPRLQEGHDQDTHLRKGFTLGMSCTQPSSVQPRIRPGRDPMAVLMSHRDICEFPQGTYCVSPFYT